MSKMFVEGKFEVIGSDGSVTTRFETAVADGTGSKVANAMKERIRKGITCADGVRVVSINMVGFRRVG